jgi:hypothetical protein
MIAGLGSSSLPARADDRDGKQARKRRQELEEAKRRCGDHHDRDHHDGDHDHNHN